jgi:GntR family transcriptional regulator
VIFELNFKSGKPVYLQLVDQVRAAAATGLLRPGDALPSIRPLAEQLRVNRNTIAKAYAELESQGVIETQAGRGCYLKENQSPLRKQVRRELLVSEIDEAIVAAHHLQVPREEFLGLVEDRLRAFGERLAAARKDGPMTAAGSAASGGSTE